MRIPSVGPALKSLYMKGVVEPLASGIGKISRVQPFKGMVNFLEKNSDDITATLAVQILSSLTNTLFTMHNISESKKIDGERKPFLVIDAVVTFVITSLLSYVIDKKTAHLPEAFRNAYKRAYPMLMRTNKKAYDLREKSVKMMKSHAIYASVVRTAIPILLVPVVGTMVSKFNEYKREKAREVLGEKSMQSNVKFNSKNQ